MEKLRRNTKRAQKLAQQPKPDTAQFDLPEASSAPQAKRSIGSVRTVRTGAAAHPVAPEPAPLPENIDAELDLTFAPPPPPPKAEPTAPPPPKYISLAALHRQRSARRLRRLALITLAVTMALVWLIGTYGSNLAVLGDMLDGISVAVNRSGSFPVKTGITQPKQLLPLSDGFVELGDTDLLVYSGDGTQLRSLQPGYARPIITAGNTRFCVYNRAGTELKVESRSKNLYTFTTSDPILLCAMSGNGTLGVVTKSTRYSATLRVYNSTMVERWAWTANDSEGVPVSVAFASDNHRMAVGCLVAENGTLHTNVYFLDLNRDDITARYTAEGALVQARWLTSGRLLVVYEDRAEVVDTSDGSLLASRSFDGLTLQNMARGGSDTALLLTSRAGSRVLVLDEELTPLCDVQVWDAANAVTLTRKGIYLVYGSAVEAFDRTGVSLWRNEYTTKTLAVLDLKHLLVFTGNTVQILEQGASAAPSASANE